MRRLTWGLIGTLVLGTMATATMAAKPFPTSRYTNQSQTETVRQEPKSIQQLGFRQLQSAKNPNAIQQVDWQLDPQAEKQAGKKRYVRPAKFGDVSGQLASSAPPSQKKANSQPQPINDTAASNQNAAIRQVFFEGGNSLPVQYAGQPVAVVNPGTSQQPVAVVAGVPTQQMVQTQIVQPRQVQYVAANQMHQPSLLSAIHANYVGGPGNVSQMASQRRYSALLGSLGHPQLVSYQAADGGVNTGRGGGSCENDGSSCGLGGSCGTNSCGSCETCCEPCCPNIFFTGTYLYWQTTRSVHPYTAVTNGGFDPDMNTRATAQNADYDFNSGYRLALGYQFCSTWDVAVRYTSFTNNGSAAVNNRNFRLLPLQAHPAFVANSQFTNGLDFARTRLEFDLDTIDLEVGKWFNWCDCTVRARAFGGFRWGQIDQSTFTRYVVTVNPTDTDQILLETDMEGFGLRAGGELYWDVLGQQGLALFSRGALSLLYAEFDNRRLETLTQEINRVAMGSIDFHNRFDDIVPVTELAVGTEFTYRNFRLAVGYEFNMWFNMVNDARFINNTIVRREQLLDIERGSLGLHGLFVEGTITF